MAQQFHPVNPAPARGDTSSGWPYRPSAGFFDEMLADDAQVRAHWRTLIESVAAMGADGLAGRWQEGRRLIRDNGVTYNVYEDPRSTDRPWPLDPIPLVIEPREWIAIEGAMRQRATLLNAILADIYGAQRLMRDGIFPPELVFRHPNFLRPCCDVPASQGIYLHNYCADLARSPDGQWWVIADRTQAPSGAGYALENRLVSQRVLPDVFRATHVRRLADYFQSYRNMLRDLAPHHRDNPRVVLLTPGPYNETYFEHAFLARYLGFTLVEGADLTIRGQSVFLKTLGGLLPVDVIVRRQDDSFCDPAELREDSVLGVPGLVQAVRAGNVAIANALGSGLLESPAHAAFLPSLCRHILGEELKMPTVATWWCGDEDALSYVSENLWRFVIKPTLPESRRQPLFGGRLSAARREQLIEEIHRSPADYVAQEQVALSTVPVLEEGEMEPRHMVLRVYLSASGGSYVLMPGGLTRVTSSLDSLVASMQHGGGSKDTWVLGDGPASQTTLMPTSAVPLQVSRATFELPSRVADNLFWLGRYVERVEFAVRITRVILSRISQESDSASAAGINTSVRILAALGHLPAEAASSNGRPSSDRDLVLEREIVAMIHDSSEKTSLGWTLEQLRRVAYLLRDRFSVDAWRILNRFDRQFSRVQPREPLRSGRALNLLDDAIATLSAFGGLVMESMTRGDGWRFLEIGRRLERAMQMVEMLRNGFSAKTGDESGALMAMLEIADSSLTYRSRYLTSTQPDLVLDLLLLDEANPRSVAFQLEHLRAYIQDLPKRTTSARMSPEWRIVVKVLSAVELAEAAELMNRNQGERGDAEALLVSLADGLRSLSETITRDYFDHTIASRQMAAS